MGPYRHVHIESLKQWLVFWPCHVPDEDQILSASANVVSY